MKEFKKVLNDVTLTLTDIFLFDLMLNAVIVFLAVYFVLAIFSFYPLSAIGASAIYLIFAGIKKFRQNKLELVESKYPHLREKLKTSADYIKEDNEVIRQLQEEVKHDVQDVRSSSFLDIDNTIFKTILTVLLSFLIIYVSAINFVVMDTDQFILEKADALKKAIEGGEGGTADSGTNGDLAGGVPAGQVLNGDAKNALSMANVTNTDIFGKKTMAKLGEDQIEMELKTNNYELNLRQEGEVQDKTFEDTFPAGIEAVGSELYEESIATDERELVKKYFDKLSQE